MNYKDKMGQEISKVYEEDTKGMKLSSGAIDNIMESRKLSLKQRIDNFLNKEVEVKLAPAVIGFILILGIAIIPKDFSKMKNKEIIDFNGSQIIISSLKGDAKDEV